METRERERREHLPVMVLPTFGVETTLNMMALSPYLGKVGEREEPFSVG